MAETIIKKGKPKQSVTFKGKVYKLHSFPKYEDAAKKKILELGSKGYSAIRVPVYSMVKSGEWNPPHIRSESAVYYRKNETKKTKK